MTQIKISMNRRFAMLSMFFGWLLSLIGFPQKAAAIPVDQMEFQPEKTEGPYSYFRMLVENAGSSQLKPVLDAVWRKGWSIYSMQRDDINRKTWHLCFYRMATGSEIVQHGIELRREFDEYCRPRFESGCRWCGKDAPYRQVPASVPTSDCYCSDCADKCGAYYQDIHRRAMRS